MEIPRDRWDGWLYPIAHRETPGDHAAYGRGQCKNRCVEFEVIRLASVYPCRHQVSDHATRPGMELIAHATRQVDSSLQRADVGRCPNLSWGDDVVYSLMNRLVLEDTAGPMTGETVMSPRSCFHATYEVHETGEKEWWPWFPNAASRKLNHPGFEVWKTWCFRD